MSDQTNQNQALKQLLKEQLELLPDKLRKTLSRGDVHGAKFDLVGAIGTADQIQAKALKALLLQVEEGIKENDFCASLDMIDELDRQAAALIPN